MKHVAIAIDGPSGAGKSTIAKALAGRLGYIYVDTGALYRALGYAAVSRGADPHDADAVGALLPSMQVSLRYVDGRQRVYADGEDVSERIRTPEMSMAASAVSAQPAVRQFLFQLQQDIAAQNDVIMDGRDIGTVVLPHADVKIFLSASAEDRARRRYLELIEKGQAVTFEEVLSDLQKRDYDDSHRAIAPLKAAEDAIMVDTTGFELEQSIALLFEIVQKKLGGERV